MYGGVPVELLLDIARREGAMFQLELPLPPYLKIDEKYLTDCPVTFKYATSSAFSGSFKTIDHPAFGALRAWLGVGDYIEINTNSINGDRVLKPFYLNDHYFEAGDRFLCAVAIGHTLAKK